MKILLTGSSGFLGKELYSKLKLYDILTLSRNNSLHNIDLSTSIPSFDNTFDLVIHSAGKAHLVPDSDIDKDLFYKINVLGTKNLLEGLSKFVPKQFIYISSVSVYGLIEGTNIKETQPLLAEDPYGKSKIEAEDIVKNWCHENNVICTILRLPLVVGVNPPGNLGSMISYIKKGFYFNIGGGNAKKSMVLASDIGNHILKISKIGGIYNLTDGMHPSFKELSYKISKDLGKSRALNLPYFLAYVIAKIGDLIGVKFPLNSYKLIKITSTLTFDDSMARKTFSWTPNSVLKNINFKSQK